MEHNFQTDMRFLEAMSVQVQSVIFSSVFACHSNANVSNGPASSKLSQPDHLVILYMSCDGSQDDLLRNFP